MQFIGYIFFRLLIGLFWLLPFPVVYLLSDGFTFLFHRVLSYRKSVIVKNLKFAFPDYSDDKIKSLLPEIYRNFSDIVVEALKGSTMRNDVLQRRHKFVVTPEFMDASKDGRSIVIFAAHYGNWEWATMTLEHQTPFHVIGLIKPLGNKYIHNFIQKHRAKVGTGLVSVYESKEILYKPFEKPTSVVYIADQNPSNNERAHWIQFFGVESPALQGGAKYAHSQNMPAWFYKIERVKRGFYEVTPILLNDQPSKLDDPIQITQSFFSHLEEQIRSKPEYWLWTHKRWKKQIKY